MSVYPHHVGKGGQEAQTSCRRNVQLSEAEITFQHVNILP